MQRCPTAYVSNRRVNGEVGIAVMQRHLLALLAATLFPTGCVGKPEQSLSSLSPKTSDACSETTAAKSVQILLPPGSVPLRQNAYSTPPYPKINATFYNGSHNLGIFGSGSGVFYFQCGTERGTRYASASERAEFQRLIARPDRSK